MATALHHYAGLIYAGWPPDPLPADPSEANVHSLTSIDTLKMAKNLLHLCKPGQNFHHRGTSTSIPDRRARPTFRSSPSSVKSHRTWAYSARVKEIWRPIVNFSQQK